MNFWNWFFRRKAREVDLEEEVQTHLRLAAQVHSDQAVAELTTSPHGTHLQARSVGP